MLYSPDRPLRHTLRPLALAAALATFAGCAVNPRPHAESRRPFDRTLALHVLNRITFGARVRDLERIRSIGVAAFIDEQLHPERLADGAAEERIAQLHQLAIDSNRFAREYYLPMIASRQQYTQTQHATAARLPALGWHLLPVVAVALPAPGKPTRILQQSPVTPAELLYQRENQRVFDDLQAQKLVRAVYSERQLQEVLTDFWFNHFNVDARKIEDKPVMLEYEREVIRPRVFGRFRDLLEANAKSPAMLFYLDNWLSSATGRGVNENYARELMELHTLGVDGGYTQHDVREVARAFTGWTMRKPHEATGFEFNPKMHDRGEKRVLARRIRAGGGIEDGEQVLDLLAHHPSTARFISTELARHFVADDPPKSLVDRMARTFRRTDGDLREVMRTLLTSREFLSTSTVKMKTPLEVVASTLRAADADLTSAQPFVSAIANMGEPLYQCQPPTGYPDRAAAWINTGTLLNRLNFAQAFAANRLNGARSAAFATDASLRELALATDSELGDANQPAALRAALLLGSPRFLRR